MTWEQETPPPPPPSARRLQDFVAHCHLNSGWFIYTRTYRGHWSTKKIDTDRRMEWRPVNNGDGTYTIYGRRLEQPDNPGEQQ